MSGQHKNTLSSGRQTPSAGQTNTSDSDALATRRISVVDMASVAFIDSRLTELSGIIAQIKQCEEGKCIKIEPPLTAKQRNNLNQVCRYRGFKVKTRQTPEATYVWNGGPSKQMPSVQARRPNRVIA